MRRLLLLLTLALALAGCGKDHDKARIELAQMNIAYTDTNFIENAQQGNTDVVSLFLDAGIDTEVKTPEGQTALMAAALTNKIDVIKKLLESGADVNAKNRFNGTALMSAAWKGHSEIVQLLLASFDRLRRGGGSRRSPGTRPGNRGGTGFGRFR